MNESTRRFVDSVISYAQLLLKTHGYLTPVAMLFIGDQVELIALDFKDDETKRASMDAVRGRIRLRRAAAVLFVSEAWAVTVEEHELETADPSTHPDRTECVLFTFETESVCVYAQAIITREPGRPPTFSVPVDWVPQPESLRVFLPSRVN
jgi:hypothetical protein